MTISRRQLLTLAAAAAGGTLFGRSSSPLAAWGQAPQAAAAPPTDAVAAIRAQMGAVPIATTPLVPGLVMLSGPGGNVVVQAGPDGKLAVDSFVQPAWPKLKATIAAMGPGPITLLIDTHWHLDHTDNNANFHKAGAEVLAHDNTRKRLNETHDLMGMHFEPVPPSARPTETFRTSKTLQANGDTIDLAYFPPAHTDSDIYIHFTKANVLHMGDVFFNGVYPFIDARTGGNINGMIDGAAQGLKLADDQTKIVPGHGPLADKAALQRAHDMLVTVRDRVKALKDGKKSLADAVAAKPSADLDATWGKGSMQPDAFVTLVYNTL
jgi:glyoxylase-like metal-dependent hydrolase (beta-lactamase superfamily II)